MWDRKQETGLLNFFPLPLKLNSSFQFLGDLGCQDSLVDLGVGDHREFID
jgi:hypothetical protein